MKQLKLCLKEMESIEQIAATAIDVKTRSEAVDILKHIANLVEKKGEAVQKSEILNLLKEKNNEILNAALRT